MYLKKLLTRLQNDAMSLQQKFHKSQESGDIRASIDCLRLLKDTLSLIKEYDWHLEYSEYKTDWTQKSCSLGTESFWRN